MYPQLKAKDLILFFDPPLNYDQNGTDLDPAKVIGVPGSLTTIDDEEIRKLCTDSATRPLQPCDRCATFPLPGILCGSGLNRRELEQIPSNVDKPSTSQPASAKDILAATAGNNTTSTWKFEGSLVISHIHVHSAKNLCANPYSYGPDFVAISEGKFCDMKRKSLWDTCSAHKPTCCFDIDQKQLQPCTGMKERVMSWSQAATVDVPTKYTDVNVWSWRAT